MNWSSPQRCTGLGGPVCRGVKGWPGVRCGRVRAARAAESPTPAQGRRTGEFFGRSLQPTARRPRSGGSWVDGGQRG